MQKQKRTIGIIGGGPGGLTLARVLSQHGITSTVLELDAHPDARPQGGSLDLHVESGQWALHQANLDAEFRSIARYEDQGLRLYDHLGALHFEEEGSDDGDRPEVDRTALRRILLASLPPGTVRWGSKVRVVNATADGRFEVVGAEGSLGTFDLVVGADGAWSKVRALVSSEEPAYCGVTFVELGIDAVDTRWPEIASLVGQGKVFALGEGKCVIAQRNEGAHVRVYLAFRVGPDWVAAQALDRLSPSEMREALKHQLAGWSRAVHALIDASNDVIVPRPLVALPVGHRWVHRPGVTLLGDAAHVMSPFAGEGVNIAMMDAADLGLRLANEADWNRAIERYEAAMFVRAEESARASKEGLEAAVCENGLANMLAFFSAMGAE